RPDIPWPRPPTGQTGILQRGTATRQGPQRQEYRQYPRERPQIDMPVRQRVLQPGAAVDRATRPLLRRHNEAVAMFQVGREALVISIGVPSLRSTVRS